jgi:IclR family mhp operon transcriptional activator
LGTFSETLAGLMATKRRHRPRAGTMRALERGLAVLAALEEHGHLSLHDLHRRTGISKSALLRILATLEKTGHARRRLADGEWRRSAQRAGPPDWRLHDLLVDIGGDVLDDMCRRLAWPSDLAIYHRGAMELLETSRRKTPFSVNRLAPGFRIPVLLSGLGRAWIAFCSEAECAAIVAELAASDNPFDRPAQDMAAVQAVIAETRAKGYGIRADGYSTRPLDLDDRTCGIAVPICLKTQVVACINLVWVLSACDEETFVRRYLGELRSGARRIEQRLAAAFAAQSPDGG